MLIAVAGFVVACSDDGTSDDGMGPAKDKGVDTAPQDARRESGDDLIVSDLRGDGNADLKGGEALPVQDTSVDAPQDAVSPGDGGVLDLINPKGGLYGTVTSTVTPVFDGKGTLYVGLYNPFLPPPLLPPQTYVAVAKVDFSKAGNSATYQFSNNPSPGDYLLYAFLDDNGNASYPFLAPDNGDLVVAGPINIKIVAGTAGPKKDIVLSTVVGATPGGDGGVDAHATTGSLSGQISVAIKPVGDAKGNVHVQLFTMWPPTGGPLGGTMVSNADLSSPYASVKYFVGTLIPGKYYMNVFLDDNSNAAGWPFTPAVDKNDLVPSVPPQIRVEAGVAVTQNVTLDKVQP